MIIELNIKPPYPKSLFLAQIVKVSYECKECLAYKDNECMMDYCWPGMPYSLEELQDVQKRCKFRTWFKIAPAEKRL